MGKREQFTDEEIANVFWESLKKDPEHVDRRRTAWGGYTKKGIAAIIKRLGIAGTNQAN